MLIVSELIHEFNYHMLYTIPTRLQDIDLKNILIFNISQAINKYRILVTVKLACMYQSFD